MVSVVSRDGTPQFLPRPLTAVAREGYPADMTDDISHLDFHPADEIRAGKIVREEAGVRFEMDVVTGETGLYYPDGTYFRDEHDYDHGWIWRKPGMKYSQVRRTFWQALGLRALNVLMIGLPGLLLPAIWGSMLIVWNPVIGYLLTAAMLSGVAVLAIQWIRVWDRSMFEWSWHGHLYSEADKRAAGIR